MHRKEFSSFPIQVWESWEKSTKSLRKNICCMRAFWTVEWRADEDAKGDAFPVPRDIMGWITSRDFQRNHMIRRWEKQLESSDRTRRKASYNCSIQVRNLVPAPEVSVTAASQKTGRGQKEAWAGSREEAGHTSFREGIGPTRDSWRNKDESDVPEWRVKF